jgi:hypothetical protein
MAASAFGAVRGTPPSMTILLVPWLALPLEPDTGVRRDVRVALVVLYEFNFHYRPRVRLHDKGMARFGAGK